jgi:transcriptional regulator with XRE-family HTH domain
MLKKEGHMRTLGKTVRERRLALGLTQRAFAARVRFEDGHAISATYLCLIEHDLYKPRGHIIAEFARVLGVNPDVFFYLAGRVPPDLHEHEIENEELESAFRAFRQALARGLNEPCSGSEPTATADRNSERAPTARPRI